MTHSQEPLFDIPGPQGTEPLADTRPVSPRSGMDPVQAREEDHARNMIDYSLTGNLSPEQSANLVSGVRYLKAEWAKRQEERKL